MLFHGVPLAPVTPALPKLVLIPASAPPRQHGRHQAAHIAARAQIVQRSANIAPVVDQAHTALGGQGADTGRHDPGHDGAAQSQATADDRRACHGSGRGRHASATGQCAARPRGCTCGEIRHHQRHNRRALLGQALAAVVPLVVRQLHVLYMQGQCGVALLGRLLLLHHVAYPAHAGPLG